MLGAQPPGIGDHRIAVRQELRLGKWHSIPKYLAFLADIPDVGRSIGMSVQEASDFIPGGIFERPNGGEFFLASSCFPDPILAVEQRDHRHRPGFYASSPWPSTARDVSFSLPYRATQLAAVFSGVTFPFLVRHRHDRTLVRL